MKTKNQAPQGAYGLFWGIIILMVIAICWSVAFHAKKHVKSESLKNIQSPTAATAAMPKTHAGVANVESATQPMQTDNPMVIIDQGATVTFSSSSKVQTPPLTEKQVLAMQLAAKLAAATNKQ